MDWTLSVAIRHHLVISYCRRKEYFISEHCNITDHPCACCTGQFRYRLLMLARYHLRMSLNQSAKTAWSVYGCSSWYTVHVWSYAASYSFPYGNVKHWILSPIVAIKAKQRCVMGVGMCLYAQLVQTKNKQCKSAIILQCYHPHFCCAMLCIARLLPSPGVRLSVRPSRSWVAPKLQHTSTVTWQTSSRFVCLRAAITAF